MSIEGATKWAKAEEIGNQPRVHEALRAFSHDSTADNATGLICEILDHLPPVDMVIFCPSCGKQHIDDAEPERTENVDVGGRVVGSVTVGWDNPPHRSHLCHYCKHVWRHSDVPTNGVEKIETRGTNDSTDVRDLLRERTVTREFTNELGNAIRITIEGPTSTSENVLTPAEAEHLRGALEEAKLRNTHHVVIDRHAVAADVAGFTSSETLKEVVNGITRERDINRRETHRRALRVVDVLKDLRNDLMNMRFSFAGISAKKRVLEKIDNARTEVARIIDGDIS